MFGPILLVWFAAIAALGVGQIGRQPEILAAFNPVYGLRFSAAPDLIEALLMLGALMLVVTGGEAMYADLGHFGARPIRSSWFAVVFPALMLNYLGQGAYLLGGAPVAGGKLFYSLVPRRLLYPHGAAGDGRHRHRLAGADLRGLLAGLAGDPASACSRGSPSCTPISAHAGQIYIPFVNWALFCRLRRAGARLRLERRRWRRPTASRCPA